MLVENKTSFNLLDKKSGQSNRRWMTLGLLVVGLIGTAVLAATLTGSFSSNMNENVKADVLNNFYNVSSDTLNATHRIIRVDYNGTDKFWRNESSPTIRNLSISISFQTPDQLNIKITDINDRRWEVPSEAPFSFVDPNQLIPYITGNCNVEVVAEPFSIKITRKTTGEVIFDTTGQNFIFSHFYLEIATAIPNTNIFGWGERAFRMNLGPNGTYALYNKDYPGLIEDGKGEGIGNGYGFHPYYLMKGNQGNWDLVHLRTSNAMQVELNGETKIMKMQLTGGVFDFVFFLGDSNPETAIQLYHKYLGDWQMPPFWALGWQQSKWGYHYLSNMTEIITNYTMLDLPLDVIWSDLDYMTDYIDFTIDEERFPHAEFAELLKTTGKKWVPIVDAGIAIGNNSGFIKGQEYDLFIKNSSGVPFTGIVWPGKVHFPDFFNPNATKYWSEELQEMYDMVPYAGVWIDMNEIANLDDGDVNNTDDTPSALFNHTPFIPSAPTLWNRTVSLDSTHYGKNYGYDVIYEYDVHPLFGLMEAAATHAFLKTKSNLTFALTRSSYAGSGKYTNHWLGDVWTTWDFLQLALPGIMSMNLNGIPFVGSDICGFIFDTNEQLCIRWMQIGALYPFARNHHENETMSQEPWVLGPTVLETTRVSLKLRYSILKYYYSLFVERNGAGTIFRPLFFEFPDDQNLFDHTKNITDQQILIGRGLMAAPVVYENETSVNVYFPQDNWFDYYTGTQMQRADEAPKTVNVTNHYNSTLPLYIRGGTIIQKQDVTGVKSTADLDNNFELVIAMDYNQFTGEYRAKGFTLGVKNYSNDQVIYEKCVLNKCLIEIEAISKNGGLTISTKAANGADYHNLEKIVIKKVTVYGLSQETNDSEIIALHLNGAHIPDYVHDKKESHVMSIHVGEQEMKHGDMLHIVIA